jgi:hypothetical protein
MNEEFKIIVDNIRRGNEKSHFYHNDKKYKDKYDLMVKKYFVLDTFGNPLNEVINALYPYSKGGFGVYDDDPNIQKFSKVMQLASKNESTNNTTTKN